MANYPLAHASSPTPTKVTAASTTIVSNSIVGAPGRSCLVVTCTSDADVTSGGVPTISHTGGEPITWTRVPIALGYSSTGDVGVVVAFAGVYTDLAGTPPTTRATMTVTVTLPGVTASKPKLLIPRVYDETQVDITNPIGAATGVSFSTGTLVTATLTPQTSEGGIRAIQLDWSATGVPTAFVPNNDNTEVVDSFHNAGLSTNLALSGERRTRAGVDEAIGSRLLASATDGNLLAYELRGPQPAPGPAFDATAFDGGFDTDAAAGTTTGTLSAGLPIATSSISGSLTAPTYAGTLSAAVPRATSALTSTVADPTYTATLTASVPRATAALSGSATAPSYAGVLAAAVPVVTASLSGSVTSPTSTGALSAPAPLVTATIVGTVTAPSYAATLSASVPIVMASLTGTVTGAAVTGTLTASTPVATASLAGTVAPPTYTGTTSATVPVARGSVAGTVTPPAYTGTLTVSLPPTQSTITGTVTNPAGAATLSAALPRITGTLPGVATAPTWTGTLGAQLSPVTGTLPGVVTGPVFTSTLTRSLPIMTGTITGTVTAPSASGVLVAALPRLTGVLVGVVARTGPDVVPPVLAVGPPRPRRYATQPTTPRPAGTVGSPPASTTTASSGRPPRYTAGGTP